LIYWIFMYIQEMTAMIEKTRAYGLAFEKALLRQVRKNGGISVKNGGFLTEGVKLPDLTVMLQGSHPTFVECKAYTTKKTLNQLLIAWKSRQPKQYKAFMLLAKTCEGSVFLAYKTQEDKGIIDLCQIANYENS